MAPHQVRFRRMEVDPHEDRRSQYRNHERVAIQLTAELIVGPGRAYSSEVVNTSANGVRLTFPGGEVPSLPLGTLVEVRFCQAGVGRPLVALGQVGNQGDADGVPALAVRFTRREEFHQQLTPELWRQFNRRAHPRVILTEGQAPAAKLESGGQTWSAHVFDLCSQGIGLSLDPMAATDLSPYELLRVRARVPGMAQDLDLVGVRIHETARGHDQRLGLRFDPIHTTDFGGQQDMIQRFVRQVQLARREA